MQLALPNELEYVMVEVPKPAGYEPVNPLSGWDARLIAVDEGERVAAATNERNDDDGAATGACCFVRSTTTAAYFSWITCRRESGKSGSACARQRRAIFGRYRRR